MIRILLLFFCILLTIFHPAYAEQPIKRCEFCGSFYSDNKADLEKTVQAFLSQAYPSATHSAPIGMVVPHAGYIYSAKTAAYAYKLLEGQTFDSIIILASAHQHFFSGIAVYEQGAMQTPLGEVTIDSESARAFKHLPFMIYENELFDKEHAIEVELPFIQTVSRGAKIVPLLFGSVELGQIRELAAQLLTLSTHKKILLVVSTDMSHYLDQASANKKDRETIDLVLNKDINALWVSLEYDEGRMCGMPAVIALMEYAQLKNAKLDLLDYSDSAYASEDTSRVVGYMSAAAFENTQTHKVQKEGGMSEYTLTLEDKKILLSIARGTLTDYLKNRKMPKLPHPQSENLLAGRGAFVTLKKHGQLRGCIGRLVADKPLYEVVSSMAIESATQDPRFEPVQFEELKDIEIEISVLTPFEKVKNLDEIEVGVHGLIIRKGYRAGLLLPQVPTEQGWDKKTFLEHTCLKAGLPEDAYLDKDAQLERFSAIVFNESDFSQ